MTRAALYVRVSTREQRDRGMSVDDQITSLVKYCEANGYTYELYNDAGISGNIPHKKRPAMMKLIDDCKAGRVDVILFTRLDRFFRNMREYYRVMDMINNVEWNAILQQFDMRTAQGRMNLNLTLSFAQMESDIDSERIKSVLDYKRQKGDYVGTVPIGYKRIDGKLYKDEETRHIVEKLFEVYLATGSSSKARRQFEDGKYIPERTLNRILTNPCYYGVAQMGECEPYITKEQYDRIQVLRSRYTGRKKTIHNTYIFQGIMKCGHCGRSMHGAYSKPDGTKTYLQYYCRVDKYDLPHTFWVSVSEKKVEKFLLAELDRMISDLNYSIDSSDQEELMAEYTKTKSRLEGKLERIKYLFEEGDLTVEEYKKKKTALTDELMALREPTRRQKIELPHDWKQMYSELSQDGKKAFWGSILQDITITKGADPKVTFIM